MRPALECRRRRRQGFTLVEVMVVMLIVGILATIAIPAYLDQVRQSRRAEAKEALQRVMQAQEQYRTGENTYTTDLDGDLGFDNDPVRSRADWYRVSAAACGGGIATCVDLTATAQGDQANDDCEDFTLDSRGIRGVSGSETAENCW